jgi:HlyD family secretion protein
MIKRIGGFIKKRKLVSLLILAALVFCGYQGYKHFSGSTSETRYVLSAAEKGSLITSVSGTGQVSSLQEEEIKAKASGNIVYLNMEKGQEIKKGDLLLQIDTADAEQAIEDAQDNLDDLNTELAKMKGTTIEGVTIEGTKQTALDNLQKTYESGFDSLTSIFYNLKTVMSGLEDLAMGKDFDSIQNNIYYYGNSIKNYDSQSMVYYEDAYAKYTTAVNSYKDAIEDYRSTNKYSDQAEIKALIDKTYDAIKDINVAIKSLADLIDFYKDTLSERDITPETIATTSVATLNTYSSTINGYLTSLLTIKDNIQTKEESVLDADDEIAAKEKEMKASEKTLQEAKDNLENYYVYASFDGVVAEVNVETGDSMSEDAVSANTAIATVITTENMAEISLNEVDAASVKVGQSVTLTFDAIDDLTLTGKVSDIDTIGTVSSGVVSYNVKISFDTQSDQVKPGMTISASIITQALQDVLLVPNSAIETQGDITYVQIPNSADAALISTSTSGVVLNNALETVQIEIGSSNDDYTEVASGLEEGDVIVVRTITGSSSKTTTSSSNTTQSTSILGGSSDGGPSGGGMPPGM